MGQKVNPTGFRTGITEPWKSRWYAPKKEFRGLLLEDFKVRQFMKKKYRSAAIAKVEIERTRDEVKVILHNHSKNGFVVKHGDRIAQLVICKLPEIDFKVVEEFSSTANEDREGGFGSTGV